MTGRRSDEFFLASVTQVVEGNSTDRSLGQCGQRPAALQLGGFQSSTAHIKCVTDFVPICQAISGCHCMNSFVMTSEHRAGCGNEVGATLHFLFCLSLQLSSRFFLFNALYHTFQWVTYSLRPNAHTRFCPSCTPSPVPAPSFLSDHSVTRRCCHEVLSCKQNFLQLIWSQNIRCTTS